MQRREFSFTAASAAAAAATLGSVTLPTLAQAQARPVKDGTDYLTMD